MALVLLLAGFALAAGAIWLAGIRLSNATDVLSMRLGLGEALGGAILLAIATNLPEIAIVTTAAISHNLGIATGNILGGIAIQTVVLPQAHASDVYLIALAILLTIVYMGGLIFRPRWHWARFGPDSLAVVALYALGIVGLAFVAQ